MGLDYYVAVEILTVIGAWDPVCYDTTWDVDKLGNTRFVLFISFYYTRKHADYVYICSYLRYPHPS